MRCPYCGSKDLKPEGKHWYACEECGRRNIIYKRGEREREAKIQRMKNCPHPRRLPECPLMLSAGAPYPLSYWTGDCREACGSLAEKVKKVKQW